MQRKFGPRRKSHKSEKEGCGGIKDRFLALIREGVKSRALSEPSKKTQAGGNPFLHPSLCSGLESVLQNLALKKKTNFGAIENVSRSRDIFHPPKNKKKFCRQFLRNFGPNCFQFFFLRPSWIIFKNVTNREFIDHMQSMGLV